MENSFSEEGMTERLHEITGSYHNRVQGCQTTDIRKEKRSVTQIPLKTLKLLDKQSFFFFSGVFPIGMILLFTIKIKVVIP